MSIVLKHITQIPVNPQEIDPRISDEMNRLILKCLEKEREKRYQDIEELLLELGDIEKTLVIPAVPEEPRLPSFLAVTQEAETARPVFVARKQELEQLARLIHKLYQKTVPSPGGGR